MNPACSLSFGLTSSGASSAFNPHQKYKPEEPLTQTLRKSKARKGKPFLLFRLLQCWGRGGEGVLISRLCCKHVSTLWPYQILRLSPHTEGSIPRSPISSIPPRSILDFDWLPTTDLAIYPADLLLGTSVGTALLQKQRENAV